MKVNWKKIKNKIPIQVQVKKNSVCSIKWVKEFPSGLLDGQYDPSKDEIEIRMGLSDRNTVHTYMHELVHLISDKYEVGLTENQVLKLEKAFYYILKPNNILNEDNNE